MLKRLLIMVLALSVIFGGIFGFELYKKVKTAEYVQNFKPAPVYVTAAIAETQSWTPYISSIGTLFSRQGVDLSSEQSGIITRIHFVSGQHVKKGDLLIQMDDSVEQANLRSFQAQAKLSKLTHDRDNTLIAKKSISQTRIDQSRSNLDQALSKVQQTRAIIRQKRIYAPFDGKLGIRKVEVGQFLSPGSPVCTLQSSDTLYVDFNLPEQNIPRLKTGQKVEFTVEAYPDRTFIGELRAFDSRVDPSTRNILVRAAVDNLDGALTPGMFADIHVLINDPVPVITVPQTAITYSLYGETIFLVDESQGDDGTSLLTVKRAPVTTGTVQKDQVQVLTGLNEGDHVVTSGQLKLDTGTHIVIEEPSSSEQP